MRERLALCVVAAGSGDRDGAAVLAASVPTAAERLLFGSWLVAAASAYRAIPAGASPAAVVARSLVDAARVDAALGAVRLQVVAGAAPAVFGAVAAELAAAAAGRTGVRSWRSLTTLFDRAVFDTDASLSAPSVRAQRRLELLPEEENVVLALTEAALVVDRADRSFPFAALVAVTLGGVDPYSVAAEEVVDTFAALTASLSEEASACGFSASPQTDAASYGVAARLAAAAGSAPEELWAVRSAYLGCADRVAFVDLVVAQAQLAAYLTAGVGRRCEVDPFVVLDEHCVYPLPPTVADGPGTVRHRAEVAVCAALASDRDAAARLSRQLVGDPWATAAVRDMLCAAFLDVSTAAGRGPAAAVSWLRSRPSRLDAADVVAAVVAERRVPVGDPHDAVAVVLQLGAAVADVVAERAAGSGDDPVEVVGQVLDGAPGPHW